MKVPHDSKAWLTFGQVREALDCSPSWVSQLVAAGRLPYRQTPLGRMYDPKTVEQLVKARAKLLAKGRAA